MSEPIELSQVLSNIAIQMRQALCDLRLASVQLAPADRREADPELDARAARLDRNFYQLLRLVNNLTLAGRVGQPEELPLRDQDLVEVLRDLCGAAAGLGAMLGLRVEFIPFAGYHVCAFHRPSIEQLLFQLLSNAFKFTPAGGAVTVELRQAGRRLLLRVSDTGCGIPEERMAALFDRYRREPAPDPSPHGLGLGLAICQHIAESHGGTMMAESHPGRGTRVTMSLPDRRCGNADISDVSVDYSGGFNPCLMALADALPAEAFTQRHLD